MASREEIRRAFAPFLGLGTAFDEQIQGAQTQDSLGGFGATAASRGRLFPEDAAAAGDPDLELAIRQRDKQLQDLIAEGELGKRTRGEIGGLETQLGRQDVARGDGFIAFRDREGNVQFRPTDVDPAFDVAGKRKDPSEEIQKSLTKALEKQEKTRGGREEEIAALRSALARGVDPESARFELGIARDEREQKLDAAARSEAQRFVGELRKLAKAEVDAGGNRKALKAIRQERALLQRTLSERGRAILNITEDGGLPSGERVGATRTKRFKQAQKRGKITDVVAAIGEALGLDFDLERPTGGRPPPQFTGEEIVTPARRPGAPPIPSLDLEQDLRGLGAPQQEFEGFPEPEGIRELRETLQGFLDKFDLSQLGR